MAEYLTWNGRQIVPDGFGFVHVIGRPRPRPSAVLVTYPFVTGGDVKDVGQANVLGVMQMLLFGNQGAMRTRTYYASKAAAESAVQALDALVAGSQVGTLSFATAQESQTITGMWLYMHDAQYTDRSGSPMGDVAVDWYLQFVRVAY